MPTLAQVFAEAKQPPDMAKIGPPAWAELHAWANRFATKVGASCGCGKFAQQLASFDHDLVSIYLGKHPFDEHNFVEVAQMVAETLQAWYNRKEPSVTGSSLSRAENRTQDGVPCPTKTRQSETHGRFGSTLPSDKLLASRTIPNLTELPRNSKSGLPRQSNEHNCTTVNTERSAVQNSSKQNVNGTLQTEKGLGIQQDNRLMPSEAERKPNAGINNGEMPIKTALGSATSGKELSLERKIRNVNTPVLIGQVTLNGQERSGQNARATESEQSFGMNSLPDIEANAPIAEVKSDLQQTMSSPSAKAEQPHCETLSSPASHAIRVVKQSLSQNPSNSDSDILRGMAAVRTDRVLPLCTPAQQKRLERCILALKARGSKVNPWAVCQASLECRRRRWQVPEGSGKWVYAPELRQITQASVYPWPEGMFDEDEEEDDEEEDEGMEQRENTASFHNCLSGHDWIKFQDLVGAGKKTEALELMWDKGEPHHGKIRPVHLSQSFIDTILHTAIGTGVAIGVSKVLNPPPAPPPIIKEEKPKEPPLTVINPAHVEGDQANVDLGTLLEEIDAILKKPETMGIVDAETLTIVRG